jgi:ATP-dependent Clp protease adapter protein ClpS
MNAILPDKDIITGSFTNLGRPHKVVLFNDETHSMDEVIAQIMKAISCNQSHATAIMLEAHKSGRAIVYTGHLERCEYVESVLAEIRLSTKIEEA